MTNSIRELTSAEDLEELLEISRAKPVMVLKHSTRCPTSTYAHREYLEYVPDAVGRGVECALVLVVEHRPVSLELAQKVGVQHQSPQAILIRDGKAEWNDSHEGVTKAALDSAEAALQT